MIHHFLSHRLFCLLTSTLVFAGCKSTFPVEQPGSQHVLAAEIKSDSTTKVIRKYEFRSSLAARLDRLAGEVERGESKGLDAAVPSAKAAEDQTHNRETNFAADSFTGVELLLSSERWHELLLETQDRWNLCLAKIKTWSEACSQMGEARAIALARTGRVRNALEIYETIAAHALSSRSALVFAGLLADASSFRLCSTLAKSGLQWEPANLHHELYAIQSRCLRLDGHLEEARRAISLGLSEFPEHQVLLLESALLFLSEKNLTRGCELLERLYLQEFREVAVSYNWGQCLIGRKDGDAARRVLQRGRKDWPSDRLWFLLSGEVAFLDGDLLNARKDAMNYISGTFSGDVFRPQAERLLQRVQGE